jgi:hypothetical protein
MQHPILISLAVAGAICAMTGCTTLRQASAVSADCPELEGYPDCQNGHRIDLTQAAVNHVSDSTSVGALQVH